MKINASYNLDEDPHTQKTTLSYIDFLNNFNDPLINNKKKYELNASLMEILSIVKSGYQTLLQFYPMVKMHDGRSIIFTSNDVFVEVWESSAYYSSRANPTDVWHSSIKSITCSIYGNEKNVKNFTGYLDSKFNENKAPKMTWCFKSDGEVEHKSIILKKPKECKDSFYPWIEDGVENYFETFMESDAPILVLLGETGTGKTSFIRNFIWKSSLDTLFTYEEELLSSDSFFVDFCMDKNQQLLIIEDADLLLTSRENDGNKIMSKFLNLGDGLVSLEKKKIIFTANLTDASRIDTALLRPGRCFDHKNFRRLTNQEVAILAEDMNIKAPPHKNDGYTLAEFFALDNKIKPDNITKLGFAV